MQHESVPYVVLVAEANAALERCRAVMIGKHHEFLRSISTSRDLLAECGETLARAQRVLNR